jgi:hypothetical protein
MTQSFRQTQAATSWQLRVGQVCALREHAEVVGERVELKADLVSAMVRRDSRVRLSAILLAGEGWSVPRFYVDLTDNLPVCVMDDDVFYNAISIRQGADDAERGTLRAQDLVAKREPHVATFDPAEEGRDLFATNHAIGRARWRVVSILDPLCAIIVEREP